VGRIKKENVITKADGKIVCKSCGHPDKCHIGNTCVEFGKGCPCPTNVYNEE
jgi:hypothetical protein